jgi:hypothetical protein
MAAAGRRTPRLIRSLGPVNRQMKSWQIEKGTVTSVPIHQGCWTAGISNTCLTMVATLGDMMRPPGRDRASDMSHKNGSFARTDAIPQKSIGDTGDCPPKASAFSNFSSRPPPDDAVAESPPQYCPGHPERSAFYQLFQTHFDGYLRAYEERFSRDRDPCAPWLFDRSKTSCRAGDLKEVSIP